MTSSVRSAIDAPDKNCSKIQRNPVNMDTSRTDAVVSVSVLSKLDLRNKNVRGTIFIDLKTQRRNS